MKKLANYIDLSHDEIVSYNTYLKKKANSFHRLMDMGQHMRSRRKNLKLADL